MTAEFDFSERRAWLEEERADALARLPEARRAYERAFRERETAQVIWNAFCVRLNKSLSHGEQNNQIVTVGKAISDLIDERRREYDKSGAALTKAKATVADLQWIIECRNLDLEQLDLLEHPAKPPILPAEPRSQPAADEDYDIIQMPLRGERAA